MPFSAVAVLSGGQSNREHARCTKMVEFERLSKGADTCRTWKEATDVRSQSTDDIEPCFFSELFDPIKSGMARVDLCA